MTPKEQEFLQRLRATFRLEAAEYLQAMAEELLALEKTAPAAPSPAAYERIFRTAHSLKGAARAVSAKEIELLCQPLESVFAIGKQGQWSPDSNAFDLLHRTLALLQRLLEAPVNGSDATLAAAVTTGIRDLEALAVQAKAGRTAAPAAPPATPAPAPVTPPPSPPAPPPTAPTSAGRPSEAPSLANLRISAAKLDRLRQHTEELLAVKQAASHMTSELHDLLARHAEWERRRAQFRRAHRTLQQLFRSASPNSNADADPALAASRELLELLEWESGHLRALGAHATALHLQARRDSHSAAKLVDSVVEDTQQLLLLPVSTLTEALPLMVRQLGRDQGKPVELVLRGQEVAVDKRILDEMKDPLVHLVRNAIDHGVESPVDRARAGKPPGATLTLSVNVLDGSKVELVLADDGAGIDTERVKQAAVKKGLITADEAAAMDHGQALALIFRSEVTTSPIVTDLSGRGLGLAIVQEKAEQLGGVVRVETTRGVGTRFRLILPLMLSAFRGLVVRVGHHPLVVPLPAVERVALIKTAEIHTTGNRATVVLGGRAVPLAFLDAVLELPADRPQQQAPTRPAVVLGTGDARVAFVVDEVIRDEEVRVKPLAAPLVRVRNIAGATTLASGELVPVLNVNDLLRSARKPSVEPRASAAATSSPAQSAKSILVAEDSITSRTLIKGILESAGFRVTTAVNGLDALEALRSGSFDLVVSDVQMPRLTGLDLTARIRAEPRLAHLPVILVTALASPEDRARGIDVGANAYLVKSDFDQSNLLEIVRRLA